MLHLQFVGTRMEIWPTTNCHRLISILQINFSLATISNNWKCIRNECVMTSLENGQLILVSLTPLSTHAHGPEIVCQLAFGAIQ